MVRLLASQASSKEENSNKIQDQAAQYLTIGSQMQKTKLLKL
jgi:hypothetical protein